MNGVYICSKIDSTCIRDALLIVLVISKLPILQNIGIDKIGPKITDNCACAL